MTDGGSKTSPYFGRANSRGNARVKSCLVTSSATPILGGPRSESGERHSYRNASMGSSRAALRAGYQPKKTPISALVRNAPKTEPAVNCVVQ